MKVKYFIHSRRIPIFIALFFLFSCQHDNILDVDSSDETSVDNVIANSVEGIVRIKLNEQNISNFSVSLKSGVLSTNVSNVDSILNSIGAISFKRTFRNSGKFEARAVKKGLHLWYDITYDTTKVSLSKVVNKFESINEVAVTEPIRIIHNEKVRYKKLGPFPLQNSLKSASTTAQSAYPFNDEFLSYQWHYYNDGTVTDAVKGSDINLFDAWLKQKGSSDVIVAIIDGGIDVGHEDLKDNIWVNESEISGNSSIDDEENGYKDDIYGYNFVSDKGAITAEDHGTHVAGTIGAMNGNGIGVCGIAGGDANTPGVRLMSCQVFETDASGNEMSADNFAEAIVYGADNGAVICQNSWGYDGATSLPESMKDAIDYFIENAGMDENGNQVGPMKGGVVIFASGNDASSTNAYPAMYDNVIAVAASNPDYTMSYYSNFGSWIDITAPGGTEEYNGKYDTDCFIASTYTNNEYGYMIGTSMACPHVSGVAALIVSEYGGVDFTPDKLKERLYQGVIDIDGYNNGYSNKLGAGLINAAGTLSNYNSSPPEMVTDLSATAAFNKITLQWTVTNDVDDVKPTGYKIYYSTTPFSLDNVASVSASLPTSNVLVGLANVGESMSTTITNLNYSTTYYISIAGYDVLSSYGDYSNTVLSTTEVNHSPIISSTGGSAFVLKAHETKILNLSITDPDGDLYTWDFTDESGNAVAVQNNSDIQITIDGLNADAGSYSGMLTVEDAYGASSKYAISYDVLENHAPVVAKSMDNVYIGSLRDAYTVDLSGYFMDEDDEDLKYKLDYSSSFLGGTVSGNILTIAPNSNGISTFTITAFDARGESVSINFLVMIRDDSQEVDVYPNPVLDDVNIRMGEDVDGDLHVEVYNDAGVLIKELKTTISTFVPARVDLSDLASGQYVLKLNYNNIEMNRNIVKL